MDQALFVIPAAKHVWDYAMSRLDDRQKEYQAAISGKLAQLGNQVGAHFEREIRLRLCDLHTWQERSVRTLADTLAAERVGFI